MYMIQLDVNKFVSIRKSLNTPVSSMKWSSLTISESQEFSLSTPVSSTKKTDHHDLTEILLKVVLQLSYIHALQMIIFWSDLF